MVRATAKMNALRSGIVVIGVLAFGYLNLHLGFSIWVFESASRYHTKKLFFKLKPKIIPMMPFTPPE